MGPKGSGIAALIIGKLKKEKGMGGPGAGDWSKGKSDFGGDTEDAAEGDGTAEVAAQELIDAIKGGDAAAVVEAFRGLKEAC